MSTGTANILPLRVAALTIASGIMLRHFCSVASWSTSRSRSFSTRSSNCLPVLNCIAVGGVPPTVRLMAAVRALTPPAIAVSTQVPPALANCSANTFTAADSPPEVHQWITSAFISSAFTPWVAVTTVKASASDVVHSLAVMSSSLGRFVIDYIFRYTATGAIGVNTKLLGLDAASSSWRWSEAMQKPTRKPRIGDVAARAGVSTATVSRTLASPDQVRPKTRDAVMKAVRETGYVLNVAARNLRTSRSHAVLAVLPDASNIFFSQVLRGIADTLHRHGYSLVIADTANDPAREREHAAFIQGGRVDGVLLLNGRLLPSPAAKRGHAVPTVSLCERIPGSKLPHVETANREAARAMTEHLVTLGHHRIGYLRGPAANVLEH